MREKRFPIHMPAEVAATDRPAPAEGIAAPGVTLALQGVTPSLQATEAGIEVPEAETVVLSNDLLKVEFSNLGATILRADLKEYPATLEDKELEDGEIVSLDFASADFPALSYNMVGLNAQTALKYRCLFPSTAFCGWP
jgi:hypothetical protein